MLGFNTNINKKSKKTVMVFLIQEIKFIFLMRVLLTCSSILHLNISRRSTHTQRSNWYRNCYLRWLQRVFWLVHGFLSALHTQQCREPRQRASWQVSPPVLPTHQLRSRAEWPPTRSTYTSHAEQWCARSGLISWHLSQYLTATFKN